MSLRRKDVAGKRDEPMSDFVQWPDDAPDEVQALGEPIGFFKAGAGTFVLYLVIGICALLLAAAALVGFVIALQEPAQGRRHNFGKLLVFAFVIGGAGIAALTKAFTMRGLRIFVAAKGLARQQRDKTEVLHWGDINTVVRRKNAEKGEFSIRTPFQLVVATADGREWLFDERVSRLKELRQLVEERTLPFMLPAARTALDAGERIGFGEVEIDEQGVHHGRSSVGWDSFEEARAEQGELSVRVLGARKPLWRIDLAKVPNAHVLVALAEHASARRS
jgi:hypothetical protein